MNKQFFRLFGLGFLFLDLLLMNLTFAIGKYLYSARIPSSLVIQYFYLWMFFNVAWLAAGWICNIYKQNNISLFEPFCRRTLQAYIYFLAMIMMYIFLFQQTDISRVFMITVLIFIGLGILINRLIYLFVFQFFRNRDHLMKNVIIVGYNDLSKKLVKLLEEDQINTKIIGYCENEDEVDELSNYPIVGGLSNIIEVSQQYNATEIFSTIAPEQNEAIYDLIKKADHACIRFKLVPNLNFFTHFPMHIDYFGSIPVLSLRKEPLDDVANRIRKRFYDILVSSLVIILILSWLIPLVGLIIWLDSRGPIFFVQKRTGKDNQPFPCIKFRSMKLNKESHSLQASRGDQRITRVGKFLRRSSLDEFPQFLNVFLSHMSIVGPRPHMLKHTDDYSGMINQYMVRQFLKPGITGWAQVNGFRGETRTLEDMEKRVKSDIWYLENWSLWLDTRIIFLTVYQMFKGEKNAF